LSSYFIILWLFPVLFYKTTLLRMCVCCICLCVSLLLNFNGGKGGNLILYLIHMQHILFLCMYIVSRKANVIACIDGIDKLMWYEKKVYVCFYSWCRIYSWCIFLRFLFSSKIVKWINFFHGIFFLKIHVFKKIFVNGSPRSEPCC